MKMALFRHSRPKCLFRTGLLVLAVWIFHHPFGGSNYRDLFRFGCVTAQNLLVEETTTAEATIEATVEQGSETKASLDSDVSEETDLLDLDVTTDMGASSPTDPEQQQQHHQVDNTSSSIASKQNKNEKASSPASSESDADQIKESSSTPTGTIKDKSKGGSADDVNSTTTAPSKSSAAESNATSAFATDVDNDSNNPFVQLLGPTLLKLERGDAMQAQLRPYKTADLLYGKQVVGLYFSADWCGPCRKFTPELVSFYQKINRRRGKANNAFEIVWISRCRDIPSYGQYFAQMGNWTALPPQDALGERGMSLGERYKVKSIPSLILLDGETANVITLDARNQIPKDKAGIHFPWRNPMSTMYLNLVPRSLRRMIRLQIVEAKSTIKRHLHRAVQLIIPNPQKKRRQ